MVLKIQHVGLPVLTGLCTLTAIALVLASLIQNKLVECSGGEWFGYTRMEGGNVSKSELYTYLQKNDLTTDRIDSVASYAWPALALAISGLLFSTLMLFFLYGRSESWRFTFFMSLLAIVFYIIAAVFATVLVNRANNYILSSTCMVGRDTYLLWSSSIVMIVGARLHGRSLQWTV